MRSLFRNFLLAQAVVWLWLLVCGAVSSQALQAHPSLPSEDTTKPTPAAAPQDVNPVPQDSGPQLTPKQRREIQKTNFEKTKQDTDDLAALVKALQEDLDKSNEHVFSLRILEKTEKIEKLAKKIKDEAKGPY